MRNARKNDLEVFRSGSADPLALKVGIFTIWFATAQTAAARPVQCPSRSRAGAASELVRLNANPETSWRPLHEP
jgi:hypothetical protein